MPLYLSARAFSLNVLAVPRESLTESKPNMSSRAPVGWARPHLLDSDAGLERIGIWCHVP